MAKQTLTPGFVINTLTPITCIKFLIKLSKSSFSLAVPAFIKESVEFNQLEEVLGKVLLIHLLPDYYGYKDNILKLNGSLQVRTVDFSNYPEITATFIAIVLGYWADFSMILKHRKDASKRRLFKDYSEVQKGMEVIPVPGFEQRIEYGLNSTRTEQSILVLIEPSGTLFYRSEEKIDTPNTSCQLPAYKSGSRFYYTRPGAKKFIQKLSEIPRITVGFYSRLNSHNLSKFFKYIRLSTDSYKVFSQKYCTSPSPGLKSKDLTRIWQTGWSRKQGFCKHNTVLVESCLEKASWHSNLILMTSYNIHRLKHCPSKRCLKNLLQYLTQLANESNYDVREFLSKNPFLALT
jgi:hypothetical protein